MRIDPEYNNYYVYSAIYHKGKQTTWGACPVVWVDGVVLQGGLWKKGLAWADGNYHLYENIGIFNEDSQFIEECIYTSLNEGEETFGKIELNESDSEVKWCLLEREQMLTVLDIPE